MLEDLQPVVARERAAGRCRRRSPRCGWPRSSPTTCSALAEATRRGGEFLLGVSTRGAQGLYRAAQALALCEGRSYAVPDDVQRLAAPVLAHRVVLRRGSTDLDSAPARPIERVVAGDAGPGL